jgi:FAD/FMN-containing dehydrogenase
MVLPIKKQKISGFGNYIHCLASLYRPEKEYQVTAILQESSDSILARGYGKSYGDAALNSKVMDITRLNFFLDFDRQNGRLTVQAGMSLQEIMEVVVKEGWTLPVTAGTKFISIGGAVASNIHGKNQWRTGDLAEHITNIKLQLPTGEILCCSRQSNSEIFLTTVGGLGMTGIILEVSLQLLKVSSQYLSVNTKKVLSLEEMVDNFKIHQSAEYMIGWIDHLSLGAELGKGIFEYATHIKEESSIDKFKSKPLFTVPCYFPSFILNKYTLQCFNKLHYSLVGEKQRSVCFNDFFYPLDKIDDWQKLYGRAGLIQYQFIVPEDRATHNIRRILELFQQHGLFSNLAVIKYHRKSLGYLPFSMHGYSVALDFKASNKLIMLLNEIDEIVTAMQGRVYLTKDARLSRLMFEKMYHNDYLRWKKILQELDSKAIVTSLMSKRLGFKDYD